MPFAAIGIVGDALASITIADVAIGAGVGALAGGGLAAIEGKPILTGALEGGAGGAITGGFADFGGALGGAAGIGTTAGGALGGAAGGALSSQITGGSPLVGALGGAVAGGIAGNGMDASTAAPGTAPAASTGGASSVGGPGAGAVGSAAPAGTDVLGAMGAGGDATSGVSVPDGGTVGAAMGGNPALADNPAPMSGGTPGGNVAAGGPAGGPDGGGGPEQITLASTSTAAPSDSAAPQTDPTATPDQAPPSSFLGQFGLSPDNPQNAMIGSDGSYATPPLAPGTSVVDPTTGNIVGPDDPGYANAMAQVDKPQMAPAAGAAASKTTDWSNFSNAPLGTMGSALSNNASWLTPAAGLGLSAAKTLMSNTPSTANMENSLQSQANTLNANSAQMESYLQTGTLPAGVQNSINSATASAKASIRSQYAARGMSGSSAEAQDLANVDTAASSQGANIAMNLLQTGISEANLSSQLYGQLMNASIQQNAQLSTAVGNFASSLVPKTPQNITIQAASS